MGRHFKQVEVLLSAKNLYSCEINNAWNQERRALTTGERRVELVKELGIVNEIVGFK